MQFWHWRSGNTHPPHRLDVSQHMSLCRHYVRELRRSVLIDTPDLDKSHSKRSSAVLDNIDIEDRAGPSTEKNRTRLHDDSVSRALREDVASKHSHSNSDASHRSSAHRRSGAPLSAQTTPRLNGDSSSSPGNLSSSPHNNVQRSDVRASAEKILYTYLLPGSEREIIVPQGILAAIQEAIEQSSRDDPEVFDPAKDYVFQAMERDAFPGFLRSKAMGNLVPPSMMLRLIIGLLALFGAFWTGFILIFLDYSRTTRCWVCFLLFFFFNSTANHDIAHSSIHRWSLPSHVASVHDGPNPWFCRILGIHLHVLQPCSGAICA